MALSTFLPPLPPKSLQAERGARRNFIGGVSNPQSNSLQSRSARFPPPPPPVNQSILPGHVLQPPLHDNLGVTTGGAYRWRLGCALTDRQRAIQCAIRSPAVRSHICPLPAPFLGNPNLVGHAATAASRNPLTPRESSQKKVSKRSPCNSPPPSLTGKEVQKWRGRGGVSYKIID